MNTTKTPLHTQLLRRLREREAELGALLRADDARALSSAPDEAEVTDFKEIAAQGAARAVEDVQMAHAAEELASVMAAQRRLDDGTYGLCADCGEPIPEQRLLAMPHAPYCTGCQTLRERAGEKPKPASA